MESRLEQNLSCPICRELFRDPVLLTCSHSFCKVCLKKWWGHKPVKTCPVCTRRCSRANPPTNLVLKNLVETFTEEKGPTSPAAVQTMLPEFSPRSEKLQLFCLDSQEPVRLRPIEEAASDLREQLRRNIQPLKDKLKVLDESRGQFDEAAAHISLQAEQTQTQIRAEFEKLHQFLKDEEESRVKALKEEEELKIQSMKDKMAAVSKDMEALSKTISETEEQLREADASFLLQFKAAEEKVQLCLLVEEPKMEQGALIDQVKHLGNLGFNIWMNMMKLVQFFPVVLDPNIAAPDLILAEDLTSVRAGERQKVPENPERRRESSVLGSETFVSGTHCWEVEVGADKDWSVGVIGYVQREADTEFEVWLIQFTDGKYSAVFTTGPFKPLSVKNLQRLRVMLDFDTKTLTFTNPDTNTVLHTVTDSFTKIIPFLRTYDLPLKILPKSITVTV